MHFAAWLSVGDSVRDPAGYYRNNVGGALSVLDAMVAPSVPALRLLVDRARCSASPIETPITEDHPTAPDQRLRRDQAGDRARAAALRARLRDPLDRAALLQRRRRRSGRRARRGSRAGDPRHSRAPSTRRSGATRFQVFGDDYPTPDGTCLRDYVHVTDLADAHLLALDALRGGGAVDVLQPRQRPADSVRDVIDVGRAGHRAAGAVRRRRRGAPAIRRCSTRRATRIRRELGWRPRFEDIDVIVETAWRWREAHPHGYDGRAPR